MKSVKVLMKFAANSEEKPLAYILATRFGIEFSILQADIRSGEGGRMIMDLKGEAEALEKALRFAEAEGVVVTVLSRAVHWDNEVCVHCGACTAVCTRKALSLDPVTAELRYDNDKCVACEMCTHACPTGAMRADFFT